MDLFNFFNILIFLAILLAVKVIVFETIIPLKRLHHFRKIKGVKVYYRNIFVQFLGALFYRPQKSMKNGDMLQEMKQVSEKHQDLRAIASNFGTKVGVHICDPVLIKSFYSQDHNLYEKDQTIVDQLSKVFGTGIIFSEGEEWRSKRHIISNVFHFEFLKALPPAIISVVNENLTSESGSIQTDSKTVKISNGVAFGQKIASQFIVQSFFGEDFSNMKNEKNENLLTSEIFGIISNIFDQLRTLSYFFFGEQGIRLFKQKNLVKIDARAKQLRNTVLEVIQKRVASHEQMKNSKESENQISQRDLLDFLVSSNSITKTKSAKDEEKLSYEDVIDEFCLFVFAGTETTGHLIALVLYYLAEFKAVQSQVFDEVQKFVDQSSNTSDDILNYQSAKGFTYLTAVIKETQRIYGPLYALPFGRTAKQSHWINDLYIQKGCGVNIGILENAFNQNYYPQPYAFKPERWIEELELTRPGKSNIEPFTFIPFSSGARNCIGQHLAMLQTKIVIAKLVRDFEISIPDDYKLRMTMRLMYEPENDLVLNLQQRVEIQ